MEAAEPAADGNAEIKVLGRTTRLQPIALSQIRKQGQSKADDGAGVAGDGDTGRREPSLHPQWRPDGDPT